jgi:hypothetical protein
VSIMYTPPLNRNMRLSFYIAWGQLSQDSPVAINERAGQRQSGNGFKKRFT